MLKLFAALFLTLLLVGCGRSPAGVYQTVGSEDKFRMTLELAEGGTARFTTVSKVNPTIDQSVEASMSVPAGRWTIDGPNLTVAGNSKEGKAVTYRFVAQKNGDFLWTQNGARFVKAK